MDARGARLLAARIKAGVRVGSRIELVAVGDAGRLRIGDQGVVRSIGDDGGVLVYWDRGFILRIDPDLSRFRPIPQP